MLIKIPEIPFEFETEARFYPVPLGTEGADPETVLNEALAAAGVVDKHIEYYFVEARYTTDYGELWCIGT